MMSCFNFLTEALWIISHPTQSRNLFTFLNFNGKHLFESSCLGYCVFFTLSIRDAPMHSYHSWCSSKRPSASLKSHARLSLVSDGCSALCWAELSLSSALFCSVLTNHLVCTVGAREQNGLSEVWEKKTHNFLSHNFVSETQLLHF